ncbi:hypothetical protein GLAREA_01033 [Glarea lozoyensis ATCC 20868]|uniref:DUF7918 domain-containing protein n=1 Tax=Glarea lozoyensis (strain ATCC 20868 / MF5171) TaxID=1116229 RepID=S3DU02_GLAL2|nr:uncharacterized protein GLAREA_01033 [Glarea lozoyensis ATCC 20868]EPE29873.1 hypothetical protein GLAREA_01033 [Glarea lozoyensis ATCC 20868]
MAILSGRADGSNEVEVRVKRWPEDTYFEEYIKTGDREKATATACERYIVPEPGKQYIIEVVLKAGYDFNCQEVRIELFFPGIEKEVSKLRIFYPGPCVGVSPDRKYTLIGTNKFEVDGRISSGARFVFNAVSIDEKLDDESDLLGIIPKSLASFQLQQITHANGPWNAKLVDKESYKKHGITSTTKLIGGNQLKLERNNAWMRNIIYDAVLKYNFYHRGSVKETVMAGGSVTNPLSNPRDHLQWAFLDVWERRAAFMRLQELYKEYQRGEVRSVVEHAPAARVISLLDDTEDGVDIGRKAAEKYRESSASIISLVGNGKVQHRRQPKESRSRQPKSEIFAIKAEADTRNGNIPVDLTTVTPKTFKREHSATPIKQELIDIDSIDVSKIKIFQASTIKRDLDDEDRRKRIKLEDSAESGLPILDDIVVYDDQENLKQDDTDAEQVLPSTESEEEAFAKEQEAQIAEIDRQMAELQAQQKADFEKLLNHGADSYLKCQYHHFKNAQERRLRDGFLMYHSQPSSYFSLHPLSLPLHPSLMPITEPSSTNPQIPSQHPPSPNFIVQIRRCNSEIFLASRDIAGDRIWITCTITYVVKGDSEGVEITIPAAGVFSLVAGMEVEGEDGKGDVGDGEGEGEEGTWKPIIKRFECFLDLSPVRERGEIVAGMVGEGV